MEFPLYDPSLPWPQHYWPGIIPAEPSDTANHWNSGFNADWTAVPGPSDHLPSVAAPIAIRDATKYLPDTSAPATSQHSDSRARRRQKDTPANKAPRRRLNEADRYNTILADEYVLWFTPTEVTCGGCLSIIQLEKRDGARYYLGRWARHKAACRGVKAGIVSQLLGFPRRPIDPLSIFRLLHVEEKQRLEWTCSLQWNRELNLRDSLRCSCINNFDVFLVVNLSVVGVSVNYKSKFINSHYE